MSKHIYTRTGDDGTTALFGGGRVLKSNQRVASYGEVDELNSILGVVRATPPEEFFDDLFRSIQQDLFSIGGQLASPNPDKVKRALEKAVIPDDRVAGFEAVIDAADEGLPALKAFILPAGTLKSTHLQYARTVCRRAERSVTALAQEEHVPEVFLSYLNRLSDLLFTLARLANHRAGVGDIPW